MSDSPHPRALARAQVFWEQSRQDLKRARRQVRSGASLEGAFLSFQAAVNALSAVCVLQGHFQLPSSDLPELLRMCGGEEEPSWSTLETPCLALEEATRANPFTPGQGAAEQNKLGKSALIHGNLVLETVKSYLKANRKRYFAP